MSEVENIFAKRLSEAIQASGVTARAVATAAGINAGYLSHLRRGNREASQPVVMALASALGVDWKWLSGEGERTRKPGRSDDDTSGIYSSPLPCRGSGSVEKLSEIGIGRQRDPLTLLAAIRADLLRCIAAGSPPSSSVLVMLSEIELILVSRDGVM